MSLLCQTMQYCCVMNVCDTCPALGDLHFSLTVSLYASSGHFPGFVNSIAFFPRWTIINFQNILSDSFIQFQKVLISFSHYFIFNIARLIIIIYLGLTIIKLFMSQILTVLSPVGEKVNFSIPWDLNKKGI